ncbi:MAG: DUF3775 domain-containing protein [Stellaceae bacterium]
MISIPLETLAFIVVKARTFDAKVEPLDLDDASNPADDGERAVLEDYAGDATYSELVAALAQLNIDQMDELLAIVWLGRGDYGKEGWREALAIARQRHDQRAPAYLAGIPLLADYIEEGLDALGYSLEGIEDEHL